MFWLLVLCVIGLVFGGVARLTPPTFPFTTANGYISPGSTIVTTLPNTILLKSHGWHEESSSDAAANGIYPGLLLASQSDGGVIPHNVLGAKPIARFAKEDALQGHALLDPYNNGDLVSYIVAQPGDHILAVVNAGAAAIAQGQGVMSNGDGTLVATPAIGSSGGYLIYATEADSTPIASTATETFFNTTYTFPANFFQVGDVFRVRGLVTGIGVTGTPTLTIKLKLVSGAASPVTITAIATTAIAVIANDLIEFEMEFVVRTITVGVTAGTIVGTGTYTPTISGVTSVVVANLASTAFDTTQTWKAEVSATWSASSASNTCLLRVLDVELDREMSAIGEALVAINNSAGSTFVYMPIVIK